MIISQIGYDVDQAKFAVIREAEKSSFEEVDCEILTADTRRQVASKKLKYFGESWNDHYWTLDFSDLPIGEYVIEYPFGDEKRWTEPFKVAENVFLNGAVNRFTYELDIRFMENRLPNGGFRDCGSPLREVTSHAVVGEALLRISRLLELNETQRERIDSHLLEISRYLRKCLVSPGVYAHEAEGWEGGLHERCRKMRNLHDCSDAGIFHIQYWEETKRPEDLADAIACAEHLLVEFPKRRYERIYLDESEREDRRYQPWQYYQIEFDQPIGGEYRTAVLLRALRLFWRCHLATGEAKYRTATLDVLKVVDSLQIKTGDVYGDYLTWPDMPHRQKLFEDSWSHYFKGNIYNHYLGGLIDLASSGDIEFSAAKAIIKRYLDGFVLPSAQKNPFSLPANGLFKDGLLWFSGIRHAMNSSYPLLFADLVQAGKALDITETCEMGEKILLWLHGLNCGVRDSEQAPYHGISAVYGVGRYYADCWSQIPGAVSSGFSAWKQHFLKVGSPKDDRPDYWHDEDWMTHSAALMLVLAEIYDKDK